MKGSCSRRSATNNRCDGAKSSPHAELQRLLVVLEDPSPPLCP
eukprot:COSAG03_NODE_14112_length_476_cov_2.445623_1_plen_42_part_10